MERSPRRRRPEPAALDITWVSCRGVRSPLPFHAAPCLYASIFVAPSSARGVHGTRRPHRVKTPTDRAGGANPEWDAPLRLYLPAADADASPPPAAGKDDKKDGAAGDGDVLLLRFEIKAEVAVLGDKLAASAAVPVPGLVADGRTRRVSYQLAGPDGKQRNGVISFSYAFHDRNGDDDDGRSSSDGEEGQLVAVTPPPTTGSPVAHSPPTAASSPRLYPLIEWLPAPEQMIPIYPPLPVTTAEAAAVTVASSRIYPPPPAATSPVDPLAVYPPPPPSAETVSSSSCSVYPPAAAGEVAPAGGTMYMYPTVDLAPVMSCYPPAPALYGVECGYEAPAAPGWGWDDRCLYG